MDDKTIILLICAGFILLMSIITFIFYAVDKSNARNGKWRVKEGTLLTLSILGGAIGGLFAMTKLRHKTTGEHWYFTVVNILGIILHVGAIIYLSITL